MMVCYKLHIVHLATEPTIKLATLAMTKAA
jgi:hypothetical protein